MFFKLLGRVAWKAAILIAPVLVRRAQKRLGERAHGRSGDKR